MMHHPTFPLPYDADAARLQYAADIEIARAAFAADFTVTVLHQQGRMICRDPRLQKILADLPWIDGALATSTSAAGEDVLLMPVDPCRTVVLIPLNSDGRERRFLTGLVEEPESPMLRRLAGMVALAVRQRYALHGQRMALDDYADQVSRDFEELVWMRSLAEQIERTDVRDPLGNMAAALFPPLMEMIQTEELVLVQDWRQPGRPAARDVIRIGRSTVDEETILNVITLYAGQHRDAPLVVNDPAVGLEAGRTAGLKQFLLVPIDKQHELFGWLMAVNRPESFGGGRQPGDVDLCSEQEFGTFEAGLLDSAASFLASHAKNTALFAEQEHLLMGIVRSMINLIDAKDPYTCGHSDRVAMMSRLLARELSLSPVECEQIFLTGLLHDVGKIGIPDHILQKTDRLTDEEFDLIKQHPVIGYNVLKHLDQISYVLPGVLHHHEAVDGGGYPHGLRGEEIPLSARILAVADSFDAMTSNRPYRVGMPFEKAEFILRRKSGIQWDGTIVEAFFRVQDQMHDVCRNQDRDPQPYHGTHGFDSIFTAVTAMHSRQLAEVQVARRLDCPG